MATAALDSSSLTAIDKLKKQMRDLISTHPTDSSTPNRTREQLAHDLDVHRGTNTWTIVALEAEELLTLLTRPAGTPSHPSSTPTSSPIPLFSDAESFALAYTCLAQCSIVQHQTAAAVLWVDKALGSDEGFMDALYVKALLELARTPTSLPSSADSTPVKVHSPSSSPKSSALSSALSSSPVLTGPDRVSAHLALSWLNRYRWQEYKPWSTLEGRRRSPYRFRLLLELILSRGRLNELLGQWGEAAAQYGQVLTLAATELRVDDDVESKVLYAQVKVPRMWLYAGNRAECLRVMRSVLISTPSNYPPTLIAALRHAFASLILRAFSSTDFIPISTNDGRAKPSSYTQEALFLLIQTGVHSLVSVPTVPPSLHWHPFSPISLSHGYSSHAVYLSHSPVPLPLTSTATPRPNMSTMISLDFSTTKEGLSPPQEEKERVERETALTLARQGEFVVLAEMYRNLLAGQLESPQLWYKLCITLMAAHQFNEAYLAITECLNRAPDYVMALLMAGKLCLSGDHRVLTRCGWQSIQSIRRGDEVLTFNTSTFVQEWKPVLSDVTRRPVSRDRAEDTLYRMRGRGLDVIATRDHRMLVARTSTGGLQKRKQVEYATVGELLNHLQFSPNRGTNGKKPSVTNVSTERVAVCGGYNQQPGTKIVIPGLERVCEWWWRRDRQLGFLRFLGFWLGAGYLEVHHGLVCVGQKESESCAWLEQTLFSTVFPCWWRRHPQQSGATVYSIRCPPLYEYLRVMAIGPLGYNSRNSAELRRYPHFTKDEKLAVAEQKSDCHTRQLQRRSDSRSFTYHFADVISDWTEDSMLAAMTGSDATMPSTSTSPSSSTDEQRSSISIDLSDSEELDTAAPLAAERLTKEAEAWTEDDEEEATEAEAEVEVDSDDDEQEEEEEEEKEVDFDGLVIVDEKEKVEAKVAGKTVWWNNGHWLIIDGHWFCLKRWLGNQQQIADVWSQLSRQQAIALLDGFCRADGTRERIRYDSARQPTGQWRCSSASFPLIDHLMLIGQLAGAKVDLSRHTKAGKRTTIEGRTVTFSVEHWQLSLSWKTQYGLPVQAAAFPRPEDVSANIDARGYYDYEEDGNVYCLSVADNTNFLVQRLSNQPLGSGAFQVRAHSVFVGNCLNYLNKPKEAVTYASHALEVAQSSTPIMPAKGVNPLQALRTASATPASVDSATPSSPRSSATRRQVTIPPLPAPPSLSFSMTSSNQLTLTPSLHASLLLSCQLLFGVACSKYAYSVSTFSNRKALQRRALAVLQVAFKHSPSNHAVLFALACLYADIREIGMSLSILKQCLSIDRSHVHSWNLLALLLSSQKKYIDAVKACEGRKGKGCEILLLTKGRLLGEMGQFDEACRCMVELVSLTFTKDEFELREGKATAKGQRRPVFKAKKGTAAAASTPSSSQVLNINDPALFKADVLLLLAELYAAQFPHNPADADLLVDAYDCVYRCRSLAPASLLPSIHSHLAALALLSASPASSLHHFESALALDSTHTPSLIGLASLFSSPHPPLTPNPVLSYGYLTQALQIDATDHRAWHEMGMVLITQGKGEEAVDQLLTAAELERTAPIVTFGTVQRRV